jgi:glycerol-3-phosphate dehydrogenase
VSDEIAMNHVDVDVAIVGAGVVGCALARELARYDVRVTVLEQASDICEGTSKANTAILHTGFDCVPGTLESRLVRRGYELLSRYCAAAGIALEVTGAVLVAWDDEQASALAGLADKARANGYDATRLLDAAEVYGREPHLGAGVTAGMSVPDESIIDPWSVVAAFAIEAVRAGVTLRLGTRVTSLCREDEMFLVQTTQGPVRARWLLNAAGLASSDIDGMCDHHDFTIRPRRGELIVFDKLGRDLVSSIILPVPTARTKGVLISPTVFGNVLLGPTADDVDDPGATATTRDGLARLRAAGARLMPALLEEEVTATYAGVRAASEHQDYQVRRHAGENYVCVGGIRSTGLTASLALAEYVLDVMREGGFDAPRREDRPVPTMPPLGEGQRRRYLDDEAIARDPAYGELVCHCERVSAGEIRDALGGEVAASGLPGLRRRTRAMNGRCQGFYCAARVVAMMAELTGDDASTLTGLDG